MLKCFKNGRFDLGNQKRLLMTRSKRWFKTIQRQIIAEVLHTSHMNVVRIKKETVIHESLQSLYASREKKRNKLGERISISHDSLFQKEKKN